MPLRLKLAIICCASVAIPLLLASVFLINLVNSLLREKSIQRLRTQDNGAFSLYQKRTAQLGSAAEMLADEIGAKGWIPGTPAPPGDNQVNIEAGSRARLQDLLSTERDRLSLDFLIVADPSGRVLARQNDSPAAGENLTQSGSTNPIVASVMSEGELLQRAPVAGCEVEQADFLARMWLDKAARIEGTGLDQAIVIEAGAPLISSGKFAGLIFAGQMLNNYYVVRSGSSDMQVPLVSEIRRDLFSDSDESGAVVALGDTIVASSVFRGGAADPVLKGANCNPIEKFQTLSDNGRSYGVSWLPLKSPDGAVIGGLGIASPSEMLNEGAFAVTLALLAAVAIGALTAGLCGFVFGEMLSSRLRALSDAVSRMSVGELSAEVRDRPGNSTNGVLKGMRARLRGSAEADENGSGPSEQSDEIGVLANQLEQMRGSFRMAIERLRRR